MSRTPAGTSESGGRRMRISYMAQSPEQCTSWLYSMYRGLRCVAPVHWGSVSGTSGARETVAVLWFCGVAFQPY